MLLSFKNRAIMLLLLAYSSFSYSDIGMLIGDINLNNRYESPSYRLDLNDLIDNIVRESYDLKAIEYEIASSLSNYDSSVNYYIPVLGVTGNYDQKITRPGSHTSNGSHEAKINLNITARIWGSSQSEIIKSMSYDLQSKNELYKAKVSEIYFDLMRDIYKIELTKEYLSSSIYYENMMKDLISAVGKATDSGLIKRSDLMFSNVTLKKFKDNLLNAESQIDIFSNKINRYSENNVFNSDLYGESIDSMRGMSELTNITITDVIDNNFNLKSKRLKLLASKNDALSKNEMLSIEFVTDHNIIENRKTNNVALGLGEYNYSYDPSEDSYLGVKLSIKGINYGMKKSRDSALSLYMSEKAKYDSEVINVKSDFDNLNFQYIQSKRKVANLKEQVNLTKKIIDRQIKESKVSESNMIDIMRNISSIADLESQILKGEYEIIDYMTSLMNLMSMFDDNSFKVNANA